jgi:hypothetical protein
MIQRRFIADHWVCVMLALAVTGSGAFAERPHAVDVVIHDEPPPRRILTIEYNPLLLILGKFSATIVVAPIDHHALVLNPFYFSTETAPIFVFDAAGNATQLPKQKFEGFGGELGYRYYFGERGPRGLFLGPSGILSAVKATAQNGSQTHFRTYGGAVDIGYQMLVADRVSLTLGAGVQYTKTSQSIPNQQFPSNFNVNGGVRPRLLVSLGFAF